MQGILKFRGSHESLDGPNFRGKRSLRLGGKKILVPSYKDSWKECPIFWEVLKRKGDPNIEIII